MSSDQDLRGEYKLPAAEVSKFRKRMNDGAKAHRSSLKGDVELALEKGWATEEPWGWSLSRDARRRLPHWNEDHRSLLEAVKDRAPGGKKVTVADLDRIVPKPTNRTTSWGGDLGGVRLDPKSRTVSISVEGNHAVDDMGGEWWCKPYNEAMKRVAWTRSTGGFSRYTDEYALDAAMEGGGGDPVTTQDFRGPLGWAAYKAERGMDHPDSPAGKKLHSKARNRQYSNGVGSNQYRTRAGGWR